MPEDQLQQIVVCPRDRQPLVRADDALVASVNEAIGRGRIKNFGGERLEQPLDGGLVREDRTLLYPIVGGIPVLLADEAIALDQLE